MAGFVTTSLWRKATLMKLFMLDENIERNCHA
jgi:hypothetical protein